jgi:hypothetical protein
METRQLDQDVELIIKVQSRQKRTHETPNVVHAAHHATGGPARGAAQG